MAEASIARALRLGTAEGEHATAIMVVDSVETTTSGRSVLEHFVSSLAGSISSGSAQARGLIIVASSYCPENYTSFLQSSKCIQILDCYSDPLGWEKLASAQSIRNLDGLLLAIEALGKGPGRFAVILDSLTVLLRHHSVPALSRFISQLRALDSLSAVVWLMHGDLYDARVVNSFHYLATAIVFVEPQLDTANASKNSGRLRIRQKLRNGRVREQVDEFEAINRTLKFFELEKGLKQQITSNNPHKVHFRLDLSDKEHEDRSKVVLPFEHQGNGSENNIYDGRADQEQQGGQVHYLRDSDDEYPDSDEDPDDDLDI